MSEYNEGDLIEAVKGETRLRGRLKVSELTSRLVVSCVTFDMPVEVLERNGYTITVIEKAKPKLPTEPGLYVEAGKWLDLTNVWKLCENGQWLSSASSTYDDRAAEYAPFTKLEPVADTAKKVLGAIRAAYMTDDPTYWGKLDKIATDFGVAK